MSIDVTKNTADLSGGNLSSRLQNLSLAGTGTAATVLLNDASGSGNNMVLTMSVLEGVSAFNVFNNSGNVNHCGWKYDITLISHP